MIRSMTGFARAESQQRWGSAVWELRSVNHRYLDVAVRLPDELRALEPEVRERASARVRRGKLECLLRYRPTQSDAAGVRINSELASQLAHLSREVDQLLYNPAPVSSLDLLRWPGVLEVGEPDTETVGKSVLALLDSALAGLVRTRQREGERIGGFLQARLTETEPMVQTVRARLPAVVAGMRDRLSARLAELRAEVDPQRLEQEIVLFAQRIDVAEELDRLETHIAEVRRVLGQPEAVGRRLDFLMQELNREANTLASKSADAETTRAAVELKVIIEQMREQVQNIE